MWQLLHIPIPFFHSFGSEESPGLLDGESSIQNVCSLVKFSSELASIKCEPWYIVGKVVSAVVRLVFTEVYLSILIHGECKLVSQVESKEAELVVTPIIHHHRGCIRRCKVV